MLSPRAGLALLSSSHMFVHVYSRIHLALIPVFMGEFGISLFESSFMVAVPLLCQAAASILSGQLSDMVGAVRVIVLSFVLICLGAVLAYGAVGIPLLLAAFSVLLVAVTLFHPPSMAVVSELFPRRRSTALGVLASFGTLGGGARPPFSWVADADSGLAGCIPDVGRSVPVLHPNLCYKSFKRWGSPERCVTHSET